jgi:hypothetical protein
MGFEPPPDCDPNTKPAFRLDKVEQKPEQESAAR